MSSAKFTMQDSAPVVAWNLADYGEAKLFGIVTGVQVWVQIMRAKCQ
jgi:hypothetical protein